MMGQVFSLNVIMSFEMQWCKENTNGGGWGAGGVGVGRDAQGLKAPLEAELSTNQLLYLVQSCSS